MAEIRRVRSARVEDADELYRNLRPSDLAECQAYGKPDLLEGIRESIRDSAACWTLRAPEGLVSLQPYPSIRAWLARIEALPGFVPMLKSPVGLEA